MLDLLKNYFGYQSFRPLQEEIISHALAGGDSLVLMPTGGGKSLCYQLPALTGQGITLVISPLISLMKDQVDALNNNGIAAAYINSTLAPAEIAEVQQQALSGQLRLLYIAPERLASYDFQRFLSELNVKLLAIDEAHCISEWGHDFRPDYRNLAALRRQFFEVPVMALTATATERVRQDILEQLDMAGAKTFISSFNRPNLKYIVEPKIHTFDRLLEYLKKYQDESVIIYCFSRNDTERLAERLNTSGFSAGAYHAGLDAQLRRQRQEDFIRDRVHIITATIAFGMGIDKPDVRLVVHADLPKSIEGYYQETGRAGRDALPSECVLFYSYGDTKKHSRFFEDITEPLEQQHAYEKLKLMVDYCEQAQCRRRYLLDYFGEQSGLTCENCDRCLQPAETFDATIPAQKILSAVIKTGQRFGAGHVIRVLTGKADDRITQYKHHDLSVYGIAKDHSPAELKYIVQRLVAGGWLGEQPGMYPTLFVTEAGKKFLIERQTLNLPKPAQMRQAKREQTVDYNQELFNELRAVRRAMAERLGVPPYIIFGDRTLQEMAAYLPQSEESLLKISGVGRQKLASFGTEFLTAIRAFTQTHGLAEISHTDQSVSASGGSSLTAGATYEVTKKMVLEKLSLAEISQRRGLAASTIIQHLEKLTEQGLDILYLAPVPERLEKIKQAFAQCGDFPLTPAKDCLGDDFSWDELRLVRLILRRQSQ